MPVALITGASRGLGLALAEELDLRGWDLVLDARNGDALVLATQDLQRATVLVGDVTDPAHRVRLAQAVPGHLDLLVNNASYLGPSPQPVLRDYPVEELRRVYDVNVFAPVALLQMLLPRVATVVNVSSDAAVEPYEGWGGYGSAKAALDQITRVLAVEQPAVRVHSFDPGDMRTQLHQEAFPDQDISGRPLPEMVVPALLALLQLPSNRYRAVDLQPAQA